MRIETQLSAARNDPALMPFLESQNESEAEQALACLLAEEVNPLVKQIVRYKLRAGPGNENHSSSNDVEDQVSRVNESPMDLVR